MGADGSSSDVAGLHTKQAFRRGADDPAFIPSWRCRCHCVLAGAQCLMLKLGSWAPIQGLLAYRGSAVSFRDNVGMSSIWAQAK